MSRIIPLPLLSGPPRCKESWSYTHTAVNSAMPSPAVWALNSQPWGRRNLLSRKLFLSGIGHSSKKSKGYGC